MKKSILIAIAIIGIVAIICTCIIMHEVEAAMIFGAMAFLMILILGLAVVLFDYHFKS